MNENEILQQFLKGFGIIMKLTKEIVDDPEMLDEFLKAYHIAAPYRKRVQFRKDIINSDGVLFIGKGRMVTRIHSGILIDAETMYIHSDLKE